MSMEFGDEYLAQLWEQIDWNAAESKLAGLQRRLSIAPSGKTIRGSLIFRSALCVIWTSSAWQSAMWSTPPPAQG